MKSLKAYREGVRRWAVDTFKKTGVRQWALGALVFVTLGAILLADVVGERVDLTVGQVSPKDIQATHRIVNRYQTERLRAAEADRAVNLAVQDEENYVINQATAVQARERVSTAFSVMIESVPPQASEATAAGEEAPGSSIAWRPDERYVQQVATRVRTDSRLDVAPAHVQTALGLGASRLSELQGLATQLVSDVLENERITEENLQEVRVSLPERLLSLSADKALEPAEVSLVTGVVSLVVQPNLVLDLQKVNRIKEAAMRDVQPVYVERGQMIVRRFDLVTEEHIQILQDLGLLKQTANYWSALGVLMLLALLMALYGVYLYQQKIHLLSNEGHLALLGLLLVLVAGIAKVLGVIPWEGAGYLAPIALATMLIAILLDAHVAVMAAIFLSVILAIVTGLEFKYALVGLASGLASVYSVSKVGERSDFTRAGLFVGAVAAVTMVALGLVRSESFMVTYSFLGLVNGLVSAIGAIGLFPYLETVFGITSHIRLLELSNPNQPLLRKLLMEAPGSYHHSMIVGNLAEAAAEAVGGDSLLARVGAMYHDIGKTKRPYFFIENQYGGENPHDKIAPTLSTLIIISHVKDGVELARQHKLPEVVIDFIRQHHGTTLVRYFYHKAKEQARDDCCDEKDFRYPGPKPQSKEAAIVLLADSVEAATRSLGRPTPGRIEGLVRKIVKDHLADGQLDESDITLRDLDKISEAFVRVLTGIYHKRVEYPQQVIDEMEARRA